MGLPRDAIDPGRRLTELGLDSLKYIELRNALKGELGIDLEMAQLIEGSLDVRGLAAMVGDALGGPAPASDGRLELALSVLAKLDPDHILEKVDDFTEEELDLIIGLVSPE